MAKFYAVVDGHSKKPLILNSWDQCQKEVTGAKGVKFKSFVRKEDAQAFLDAHIEPEKKLPIENIIEDQDNLDTIAKEGIPVKENSAEIDIYVDGSYELSSNRYAFGLVVVKNGEEIHASFGAYEDENSTMRNVAGEVMGAQKAMLYAKEQGYNQINLYFDYQGIESWAKGTWKRNNHLTQGYHAFYQDMKRDLQVAFYKVKGHSGDYFNDRADELAKTAFLD